jgi:hypothetical protein
MPTVLDSATTGLTVSQDVDHNVQLRLSWTPPDALVSIIDGAEPLRLRYKGAPVHADSGAVTYPTAEHFTFTAKRLRVSIRDVAASGGLLRLSDAKFHIPAIAVPRDPASADALFTGAAFDERWSIIFAEKILLGTRYRLYCRRL